MTRTLADLLPHRPPMLLLGGVEPGGAWARVDPEAPYADPDGAMPGCYGLEVMAQAVAALRASAGGDGVPVRGYLASVREYRSDPRFPAGSLLRVRIQETDLDASGTGTCRCQILLDGRVAASGLLMVVCP